MGNFKRAINLAIGALCVVGGLGFTRQALAAPGDCNYDGIMCLSNASGGSGFKYEFASNDTNLSNNFYQDSSYFPVNDHTVSIRDRKNGTAAACVYINSSYGGGLAGLGRYYGYTWENTYASTGSSIRFWNDVTCY